MPIISIMPNWEIKTNIDYSDKWAEVLDLPDVYIKKIIQRTHQYDPQTKKLVEIPQPEPEPIPEPTEEEIKEQKIKEAEQLVLRKLALQELEEDTTELNNKILEVKSKINKKDKKDKKDLPVK